MMAARDDLNPVDRRLCAEIHHLGALNSRLLGDFHYDPNILRTNHGRR
jgi:hypothetical protein